VAIRLYVGNVSYWTTREGIADAFRQVGPVESVEIATDKMTGRPKGFGFVSVPDDGAAYAAIAKWNGQSLDGRTLTVKVATAMEPRAPRLGGFDRAGRDWGDRIAVPDSQDSPSSGAEPIADEPAALAQFAELNCPPTIVNVAGRVNAALLRHFAGDPNVLRTTEVDPRLFEEIIAEVWHGLGYAVELTKQTRDGGYDVVAVRSHLTTERYLIECKRPTKARTVGVRPVRELYAVKVSGRATKGVLATTAYFSPEATMFFEDHFWELEGADFDRIREWLRMYVAEDTRDGMS
jgi:hypothetical protein